MTAFEAVFVCTGNRARSPLAALLFRRYSSGVDVRVRSAGTLDFEGLPALPEAVAAGRQLGIDLSGHRSRALRAVDLSRADVVLGFEPFHASAAIAEAQADPERTFLLGELAALVGTDESETEPAARARSLVTGAHARRGSSPWAASGVAIADPVGKPPEVVRALAAEIDRHVKYLVERMFGVCADSQPDSLQPSRTLPE